MYAYFLAPFVEFGFMQRALAGAVILAISAGPIGVFLMFRRMSLAGDAMAHAILPGAAAGFCALVLARAGGTVAAFMALTRLDEIALRLLAEGRPPETPVAVVASASLPGQAVLRTTLGACTLDAKRAALPTPALVVVGEVAGLAASLLSPVPAADAARRAVG